MLPNFKTKLISSFNRSASTYEQVSQIQLNCAKYLVGLVIKYFKSFIPNKILDIGTGSGYVTEELLLYFPQSYYLLNDISYEMIRNVSYKFKNYVNINFDLNDAEKHCFNYHDLIISNFTFQWFDDIKLAISNLFKHCDILAFSTLVNGTFKEWSKLYQDLGFQAPTFYYSSDFELEQYCLSLVPKSYFFCRKDYNISFQSITSFIKYLKKLGGDINSRGDSSDYLHLKKIISYYNNAGLKVTYKVLFVILQSK